MEPGQRVGGAAWLGGCHALTPSRRGNSEVHKGAAASTVPCTNHSFLPCLPTVHQEVHLKPQLPWPFCFSLSFPSLPYLTATFSLHPTSLSAMPASPTRFFSCL
ncbi:hypothetical protein E2C01_074274 [Portunus trituberculatus]|uniref:Uncharacterized protein n=1 Tax=Portunus trituberculatus TaxID=210409 RepID=A0A5B7I597_PORTR|nr:hypothetical protein [Portunus trituberculatus]